MVMSRASSRPRGEAVPCNVRREHGAAGPHLPGLKRGLPLTTVRARPSDSCMPLGLQANVPPENGGVRSLPSKNAGGCRYR